MRISLLVTLLVMGAVGVLLAVEAGRINRELAHGQQREAAIEQLRLMVYDLRRELETKAREFSAVLYRDPAFLAAVRNHRAARVAQFLDRQLQHPAVTPNEIRLEKIYVYDSQHRLLAASTVGTVAGAVATPPCRSLQALAERRKPADWFKPLSGICIANRQPYYAVVLPLGEQAQTGFLHLVMDLTHNLTVAEAALGMPVRLSFSDGAVVYRSRSWPESSNPDTRLAVDYSLYAHADTKVYMNLSVSKDMRAFTAKLEETQRFILMLAVVAMLITVGVALAVLQKTAINPLRALTEQLRKLRQDEHALGQRVNIAGNAEVVELGEGFNDMTTHLQTLYRNLQGLASSDPLTKLPNRALFQEQLTQTIAAARHDRKPFVLCIMDLDHFKEINDTLGHHVGDLLLAQVAERLRTRLRESDLLARMGGDEFAMLLPGLDERHASMAARLLLQALQDPFTVNDSRDDARNGGGTTSGTKEVERRLEQPPRATPEAAAGEQSLSIGASIGIVLYPDHGVDTDTLIQRADVAMYAAKRVNSGYAFYDSKLDTHSPSRFTLMGELRQAIEKSQFVFYYQPKIRLDTGEVTGVEALVRWQHPRDGLVLPEVFIPLMEQTGMLRALTPWILGKAMLQARAFQDLDYPVTVSFNLSVRDLQDPQLVETFTEQLQAHGVSPERLEIEITESALMSERERVQDALAHLSALGCKIIIDDFGIGYSSLAYLKNLPVDGIKVDRSFVTAMTRNDNDAAIVHASVDLAHNLGLEVVAEGIETEDVLHRLQKLGCDAGQGLYISRPLAADDLLLWLQRSNWGLKKRLAARPRPGTALNPARVSGY
ncbi:MAG: EAL domain-containing protein [Gammaproteobacteria bacterium]|nr:EAL domain-containing protein [Gammaproteobacteria bacterium]